MDCLKDLAAQGHGRLIRQHKIATKGSVIRDFGPARTIVNIRPHGAQSANVDAIQP
jgi:hypothetical protein